MDRLKDMKKLIFLFGLAVFTLSLVAQTTINNGMTGLQVRTIINDNFTDVETDKVDVADTAAMLVPYCLLSEAVLPADTAAMLASYSLTSEVILPADTAAMLTPYPLTSEVILPADTGAMLVPYALLSEVEAAGTGPSAWYITVASDDATAAQKVAADYVCDGSNDEVQWALANTAAAGGIVKLVGNAFAIEDDITLTAHFDGIATAASAYGTNVTVTNAKQILLHCPGNLTNMRIIAYGNTSSIPVVQMEVINGTSSYDSKFNLLDGLLLRNDNDQGVGLKIYTEGVVAEDWNYIAFSTFGEFASAYFDTNVVIEARENTGATSFINSNTFRGITTSNGVTHLDMTVSGTGNAEISQDVFEFIHMQHGANSTNGIVLGDDYGVRWNHFPSVQAMDWTAGHTAFPAINIGVNAWGNNFYGLIPQWNQDLDADPDTPTQNHNLVLNYQEGNTNFPYGGVLTIASNKIYPDKGQAEYKLEGQGAASDVVAFIAGNMRVGDKIRFRINTPGQIITISDYMNWITTDYRLVDSMDYIVLRCVLSTRFVVEEYYQHRGSSIKTVNRTIGINGVADCDFNFASVANMDIQNIDLGSIIPSGSRITAVEMICVVSLTGGTINLRAGNASGGEQIIDDAACSSANTVVGVSSATKLPAITMNWTAATNIFIGGTPSANWNTLSTGKWSVFVTFIDYHGGWNF